MITLVTPEEFVKSKGTGCPVCQEDGVGIEYDIPEICDGTAHQIAVCSCGASWSEDYNLTGYSVLELPAADNED